MLKSVEVCAGLVINAPEFFEDPAFMAWLNNGKMKFSWHTKGNSFADEYSDVVVCVDPGLSGEGSDQPQGETGDMPEYIWNQIVEACREYIGHRGGAHHYMVRLTNLQTG